MSSSKHPGAYGPLGYYADPITVPEKSSYLTAKEWFDRGSTIFITPKKDENVLRPDDQFDVERLKYAYSWDTWMTLLVPEKERKAAKATRLFAVWERIVSHAGCQKFMGNHRGRAENVLDCYRFVPAEIQEIRRDSPMPGRPYELRQNGQGRYYLNWYSGSQATEGEKKRGPRKPKAPTVADAPRPGRRAKSR